MKNTLVEFTGYGGGKISLNPSAVSAIVEDKDGRIEVYIIGSDDPFILTKHFYIEVCEAIGGEE